MRCLSAGSSQFIQPGLFSGSGWGLCRPSPGASLKGSSSQGQNKSIS